MRTKGTLSYKNKSTLFVDIHDGLQVRFETLDDEMCRIYFWADGSEVPIPDTINLIRVNATNPHVARNNNSYYICWTNDYHLTQNGATVVKVGQHKSQYVHGLSPLRSGVLGPDGITEIPKTEEEITEGV